MLTWEREGGWRAAGGERNNSGMGNCANPGSKHVYVPREIESLSHLQTCPGHKYETGAHFIRNKYLISFYSLKRMEVYVNIQVFVLD